jgi:hypothetical protein
MKEFFNWIIIDVRMLFKPGLTRQAALQEAGDKQWRMYLMFILPLVSLSSWFAAIPYYKIDGLKTGVLVFACYFILYVVSAALFVYGSVSLLKSYKAYNRSVLFGLTYVLFWIYAGDIIYAIVLMTFGFFGKLFFTLILKLGAIWIANYIMNEIIFAGVSLEVKRLKQFANWMSILLIITGLGLPYLLESLTDVLAMNVL